VAFARLGTGRLRAISLVALVLTGRVRADCNIAQCEPAVDQHILQPGQRHLYRISRHGMRRCYQEIRLIVDHLYAHLDRSQMSRLDVDFGGLNLLPGDPHHPLGKALAPAAILNGDRHARGEH